MVLLLAVLALAWPSPVATEAGAEPEGTGSPEGAELSRSAAA
jgi:hypothetical protein